LLDANVVLGGGERRGASVRLRRERKSPREQGSSALSPEPSRHHWRFDRPGKRGNGSIEVDLSQCFFDRLLIFFGCDCNQYCARQCLA
jgi:hypothetical protein